MASAQGHDGKSKRAILGYFQGTKIPTILVERKIKTNSLFA